MKPKLKFLLSLTFLFLFSGSVYGDDYQDGKDAYERKDYKTAYKLWSPLAKQGEAKAQYGLGMMYVKGRGVIQDYKEAVKWFRLSAEQSHSKAQYNLGAMYATGRGVLQDYKEAVKWYRLSAKQGIAQAQYDLGLMHITGQGVSKNYKEALKWLSLSAKQGIAQAQYNLSLMYRKGLGVSQDYKEAAKWLSLSAEQGLAQAQYDLGLMHITGQGVSRDFILAHIWLNIAEANGYKLSIKARTSLEAMMTPSQIDKAQELARNYKPDDILHDQKTIDNFFNSYKSVTAVMPKTYLAYSKEEKISYVRGQLDGEAMLMETMKHPDSGEFIDCLNRKGIEIVSGSLKLKGNLELNLPMAWSTQKLFGQFCEETSQQNINSTYANKTTDLDLINLIYDARGISKTGGSVYDDPIIKKCMERLGWEKTFDSKNKPKKYTDDLKKMFNEDTKLCVKEDGKDFQKTSDKIYSSYFHGISDGRVFIFYNYNIPNTLGYLKCFSDPDKLARAINMFNGLYVTHPDKSPAQQVVEAQGMICSKQ